MAVIEKNLTLVGSKKRKRIAALFDSGATDSCIREDLAESLDVPADLPGCREGARAGLPCEDPRPVRGRVRERIRLISPRVVPF
jgi:hypothetical protein